MRVSVELEGNLLSDRFGKYAPEADRLEGFPVRSFPIHIEEVPKGGASLALAFIDFDAIPVGGFCWIHWLACDFDPSTTFIPEDASRTGAIACTQGANSNWSPMAHGSSNPAVFNRSCGPQPSRLSVYRLGQGVFQCDIRSGRHGPVPEDRSRNHSGFQRHRQSRTEH